MKNWIKITLGFIGIVIFATCLGFTIGRFVGGYWMTKVLFSKEISDSTGCYVRIDKHFTVRYIEDSKYSKFVLFKDGAPTGVYEYASYCDSKNDMVETILNSYYSRNDSPRIYKVYKPCK